ncbi:MAG: di- and tricarboxylate transporter [Cyclobacteriaceae bacterium]|nr:MAG: di- and tricarboxylate transporter [Cyclobacteriaceae bacterium]
MTNDDSRINYLKIYGLFAGPVCFTMMLLMPNPLPLDEQAWKVLAAASWMIIWWVTEAVPIFATALIPMTLMPLLGVFSIKESTEPYANPIIFLFMGGFLIALAMEKWNLHKRIALTLISMTGTKANGIILGFMLATFVLSMWISNTATAVMMLPIAMSVVSLLVHELGLNREDRRFKRFALSLLLGIAYSANIGGAATIIGTPPNVVMVGYLKEFYDFDLAFGSWLLIGLPICLIILGITYLMLVHWLYPNKLGHLEGSEEIIKRELRKMGPISLPEKRVLGIFLATALGWILLQPINSLIGKPLLNNTVVAMAGGTLMFFVPLDLKEGKFLLDWKYTEKLPYGILLLFGGGLCLARAMEITGIIEWVGNFISEKGPYPFWILVLLLTAVMLYMTEIMSNVALVTIFLPVVIGIAQGLNIPGMMLVAPVTIAASCAFMMPISTPPNAIVFASGHIRMKDMIRAGFFLNILSISIMVLFAITVLKWLV